MGNSLIERAPALNANSLAHRQIRQQRIVERFVTTDVGRQLLRAHTEQKRLEKLFDDLELAETCFVDGITVGEADRVKMMLDVIKALDASRERTAQLIGLPKRPAAAAIRRDKEAKLLTLAQPAETHEIEPSGPDSPPTSPL